MIMKWRNLRRSLKLRWSAKKRSLPWKATLRSSTVRCKQSMTEQRSSSAKWSSWREITTAGSKVKTCAMKASLSCMPLTAATLKTSMQSSHLSRRRVNFSKALLNRSKWMISSGRLNKRDVRQLQAKRARDSNNPTNAAKFWMTSSWASLAMKSSSSLSSQTKKTRRVISRVSRKVWWRSRPSIESLKPSRTALWSPVKKVARWSIVRRLKKWAIHSSKCRRIRHPQQSAIECQRIVSWRLWTMSMT